MRKIYSILLVFCMLLVCVLSGDNKSIGAESTKLYSNKQMRAGYLSDIAYGNGIYVAVGCSGEVQISKDGMSWKKAGFTAPDYFTRIVWNGKVFVASGSFIVAVSQDGISWSLKKFDPQYEFEGLIWTGKNFVAVTSDTEFDSEMEEYTSDTVVYSSNNGLDWSKTKKLNRWIIRGMVCRNGQLYAVGYIDEIGIIATTEDLVKWKVIYRTEEDDGPMILSNIVHSDKGFVVYGSNNYTISSVDGKEWQDNTSEVRISSYISKIIWDGKQYIGVGMKAGVGFDNPIGTIQTSQDGIKWTVRAEYENIGELTGVLFNNGNYIVSGNKGAILYSKDAINWSMVKKAATSYDFYGIKWNGKIFVAVGQKGAIYSSIDGKTWIKRESKTDKDLNQIIWNGKEFLIGGDDGIIIKSKDGINWTASKSNVIGNISSISYNGTTYTCYSSLEIEEEPKAYLYYSVDGVKWNQIKVSSDQAYAFSNILWDGKRFVTVYYNNVEEQDFHKGIAYSPDGKSWTYKGMPDDFPDTIEYNGKVYVGVLNEDCGKAYGYISKNLFDWQKIKEPLLDGKVEGLSISFVKWVGNKFIAGDGKLLYSMDGENWFEYEDVSSEGVNSVDVDGNKIVFVGGMSTIITNFDPQK